MVKEKKYFRSYANEAYEEMKYIQSLINNPDNQYAKNELDKLNKPKKIKIYIPDNINNQINNKEKIDNQNLTNQNIQNNPNLSDNDGIQRKFSNALTNLPKDLQKKYNLTVGTEIQPNNNSLNEINLQNIPTTFRQKNTSLIRVLQCLYFALKDNLESTKYIINYRFKNNEINYLCFKIIQIIEYTFNNYYNNNFINSIQTFRNILSNDFQYFIGTDEIAPKMVFYSLFKAVLEDFKKYDIPWQNSIFSDFSQKLEIYLPDNYIDNTKIKINQFKNNYRNVFVDNFYFILLNIYQCFTCNRIVNIKYDVSYFIELSASPVDMISNLIMEYMSSPQDSSISNNPFLCPFCNYYTTQKESKAFLNTPNYLIIDFYGPHKNKKLLENEIDLGYYLKSNKGPRKYNLYALICKDDNERFVAYIKNNGHWLYSYDENKLEECIYESIDQYHPYFAIYKGEL